MYPARLSQICLQFFSMKFEPIHCLNIGPVHFWNLNYILSIFKNEIHRLNIFKIIDSERRSYLDVGPVS